MKWNEISEMFANGIRNYLQIVGNNNHNRNTSISIYPTDNIKKIGKVELYVRYEMCISGKDAKNAINQIRKGRIDTYCLQVDTGATLPFMLYSFDDNIRIDVDATCEANQKEKNDDGSYKVILDIKAEQVKRFELQLKNGNVRLCSDMSWIDAAAQHFWQTNAEINLPFSNLELQNASVRRGGKARRNRRYTFPQEASKKQREAIVKSLTEPMSYVWGAPGTGKTKLVLAYSVYNEVTHNGQKVLVLAPTKIALENAIGAISDVFRKESYGLEDCISRHGEPSYEFSCNYPHCCSGYNRVEEPRVVGYTIASFILNIQALEKQGFTHIYIEEAAYTNLPHGCICLALCKSESNFKLTMIGDHKQLGAVCEVKREQMREHEDMIIRDLSVLYLENILQLSKEQFIEEYFQSDKYPRIRLGKYIKVAALTKSFRYGKKLATILNEYVYDKIGLKGTDCDMNIRKILVDSSPDNRTSFVEQEKVQQLMERHDSENIVVITPYKNQEEAFRKIGISCLTIHKTQGQEWDSVILSVVDAINTDCIHTSSARAKGLTCMNTAISRVRKNLFIVCDNSWENGKDELLTAILRNAKTATI